MTKQEIYDALVAKFDEVQSINDWNFRNTKLNNVNVYEIVTYTSGLGFVTYNLFEINGDCEFGRNNPLIEKPETETPFVTKVIQEIEARKTAGTIIDAFIKSDAVGKSVCEIVAYKESGSDLTREEYVIYDDSGTLNFKKLV